MSTKPDDMPERSAESMADTIKRRGRRLMRKKLEARAAKTETERQRFERIYSTPQAWDVIA